RAPARGEVLPGGDPDRSRGYRSTGLYRLSLPALRELDERVVDTTVDLDALARQARALAIRALAGNADLVDAVLPRRRLDRGDLRRQRAPVVFQRREQIRLERDEEVLGAHAERVHRERQRVALVSAE